MNKSAYILGIVFLSTAAAAGLLHGVLLVIQGFSLVYNQSYATWFLLFSGVYLIAHLFILKYFFSKRWKFVSVIATVSVVVFVCQSVFEYFILITVARELQGIHTMIGVFSLVVTFTLGAATIAQARQDKILLATAILLMLTSISLASAVIALMSGTINILVENTIIWTNVVSNLIPIFFILIFQREAKQVGATTLGTTANDGIYTALTGVAMISAVALIIVGAQLTQETSWSIAWQEKGPQEQRSRATRFEAKIFVNSKHDTLHYLFLEPLIYDSTQRYPLVTCLHGGPTRVASSVEVTEPAPLLSDPQNRKRYPAFLFVPQGRPGVLWGGIPNVPSMDSLVFEAMDAIEREYPIDADRRYVAGISGGGYGTWHFICTFPDRFAAAMPMCGSGDPALAAKIKNVPVWAFHGDVDRNVPVSGSRNMIDAMRKAGGNPRYNEFRGVGHNVWPEVEKTAGVLDWMFSQKRK